MIAAGSGVVIISILLLATVPPVSRDALVHHLALPKLYLEHGGMIEIPGFHFSYYPMNVGLLYVVPLYFGFDIAAKYIHFSFALITGWLIYRYLQPRIGRTYGLMGVLCFLSIPIIVKLSITVYVDLGLILFSTAALILLLKWVASNFKWSRLILSAVFCGLAVGTKYNGLITLCLLTLFVPFIYLRVKKSPEAQWTAVGYGVIYLLVALLVFSPWMIRNSIWTGNPIYPLYHSLLAPASQTATTGPAATRPKKESASIEAPDSRKAAPQAPLRHFAFRHKAFGESGWEMALIPVRVFFEGRDDSPKYFDGKLNPYLFFFPLIAFVLMRRDQPARRFEKKVLGSFAALFLLIVFLQEDMRIRWIGPIIPPLVILTVYGLKAGLEVFSGNQAGGWRLVGKGLAVTVFAGMLLLNFLYISGLFNTVTPLDYLSGRVTRSDYITRFRPAYKLHVYAAHNLPEEATILGLFLGNRRYYSQRNIVFAEHVLAGLVRRKTNTGTMTAELGARGITHLMLRGDLFEKWVAQNFMPDEIALLKDFFQQRLILLDSYGGYFLYKLI